MNGAKEYRNLNRLEAHITLKEYVDALFEAQNRAIDLAQNTLSVRLDSMNEIREQLKKNKTVTR